MTLEAAVKNRLCTSVPSSFTTSAFTYVKLLRKGNGGGGGEGPDSDFFLPTVYVMVECYGT
jgi:hypothetical protein